jgi:hypothetical protein
VSLPWGRQLRVGIAPEGAAVLACAALRARPVGHLWCAAAPPALLHEPPWTATIAALHRSLPTRAFGARSALLTVSDHFCRYALIPDKVELAKHSERMAYVCHRMSGALEDDVTKWNVCLHTQSGGVLACAIERSLIEALQEVFQTHGIRVRSVRPYFAAAYNRMRARIDKPAGWILVHEPGRLVIGRFEARRWTTFASRRTTDDRPQGVVWALERERRLHALGEDASGDVWLTSTVRRYASAEFEALGYAARIFESPLSEEVADGACAYGLAA